MINWKDCGYISLTKDGKNVTVKVKKVGYFVKLAELKEVLEGKKNFTLIYGHVDSQEEWQQLEKSRKAELTAITEAKI